MTFTTRGLKVAVSFCPARKVCCQARKSSRRTFATTRSTATRPQGGNSRPEFAVAPMVQVTHNHFLHLLRLCSPNAILYTEMLHARVFTERSLDYLLQTVPALEKRVLQLGGNEPEVMLRAARRAGELGWKEINLNVGCPSTAVQKGSFGAMLMKEPHTVSHLCNAIAEGLGPDGTVTVKCRVGIDHLDTYEFFRDFIKVVSESSPVTHFIVHARKAHLKGLSPAQNRAVPPLNYSRVRQLKEDMPNLKITMNGGISSLAEIQEYGSVVEGVMLGRKIQNDPFFLTEVETELFGTDPSTLRSREQVLKEYIGK